MVKKAEQLPPLDNMPKPIDPEQTPVLEVDELCVFVFSTVIKLWIWVALNRETTAKLWLIPVVIGVKIRTKYFEIVDHPRIERLQFSATIGKRIKS